MPTLIRWLMLAACVFTMPVLVGCSAPTRTVVIDAIAGDVVTRPPGGQDYVLKPGEQGVADTDLRFREFAAHVERALAAKGYRRVDEPYPAATPHDVATIYLTYGVGTPRTVTRVYSTPVYGFSGGNRYRYNQTQIGPDGRTDVRGNVYEDSEWDRVGTDIRTQTSTYYQLFLGLDAFIRDPDSHDPAGRPLWSVEATSDGESNDLRRWFPAMLHAAEPWIGTSTPGQVNVDVPAESSKTATP